MQNYAQAVPAVQKAIAVLEFLRQAPAPPTLTQMSQALAINRSTLLAVLNTLRAAAVVRRDERERYHLGPALLSYAHSAAETLSPIQACSDSAEWLRETVGESVAILAPSDDEVVVVDFRLGWHGISAVPDLGRHYPAHASAAGLALLAVTTEVPAETIGRLQPHELRVSAGPKFDAADGRGSAPGGGQPGRTAPMEPAGSSAIDATREISLEARLEEVRRQGYAVLIDEREVGQVSVAAVVCDGTGEAVAALALIGPAFRLEDGRLSEIGPRVAEAARRASLALGCRNYRPYASRQGSSVTWRGSHSAGLHGADLEDFLAKPWVASLACLNEQGYPYTVPVWYEWQDGAFWLVPRAQARWVSFVRAHPQVSMTISEPAPPFRRVLVEGKAVEVGNGSAERVAKDIRQRLAQRYLGGEAASYIASPAARGESVIRIEPDKITSWEGLVAHPRYRGVA